MSVRAWSDPGATGTLRFHVRRTTPARVVARASRPPVRLMSTLSDRVMAHTASASPATKPAAGVHCVDSDAEDTRAEVPRGPCSTTTSSRPAHAPLFRRPQLVHDGGVRERVVGPCKIPRQRSGRVSCRRVGTAIKQGPNRRSRTRVSGGVVKSRVPFLVLRVDLSARTDQLSDCRHVPLPRDYTKRPGPLAAVKHGVRVCSFLDTRPDFSCSNVPQELNVVPCSTAGDPRCRLHGRRCHHGSLAQDCLVCSPVPPGRQKR